MNSIYLDGRALPWKVQPSPRLKKIHISVHPQEGIILRTPWAALPRNWTGSWRKTGVAGCQDRRAFRRCPTREYGDGQILPYLGEVVLRLHRPRRTQDGGRETK